MRYLYKFFGLSILVIVIYACSSSTVKNSTSTKEKAVIIANDSLEYEIIIFDIGFTLYLNTIARPLEYYSKNYLFYSENLSYRFYQKHLPKKASVLNV